MFLAVLGVAKSFHLCNSTFVVRQDLSHARWKQSEAWCVCLRGGSRNGRQHEPDQWSVQQPKPQDPGGHRVHIWEWPLLEPAYFLHIHQSHQQVHTRRAGCVIVILPKWHHFGMWVSSTGLERFIQTMWPAPVTQHSVSLQWTMIV